MRFSNSTRLLLIALTVVTAALVSASGGCEHATREGDRCNPLVLQNECAEGLTCRAADCTFSYCCPTDRVSSHRHCSPTYPGCPDETVMDDAGAPADDADAADAADAAD